MDVGGIMPNIKLIAGVLAVVFLLGGYVLFSEPSEISNVKNSTLSFDRSMTIEKLLDTYQYCQDGEWSLHETDRGQKYVEFRGKFSNYSIAHVSMFLKLGSHFRDIKNVSTDSELESGLRDFAEYLDDSGFSVDLVVRVMCDVDGDAYQISYLSLEYKGENSHGLVSCQPKTGIENIYNNNHLSAIYHHFSIGKSLNYYFKKYMLTKSGEKDFKLVSVVGTYNSMRTKYYSTYPVMICSNDEIRFDDESESIDLSASCQILNVIPEQTSYSLDDYRSGKVSYEDFSREDIGYEVLQNVPMKLRSTLSPSIQYTLDIPMDRAVFETLDKRDKSYISFVLASLNPVGAKPYLNYEGFLSEKVMGFMESVQKK